VCNGLLFLFSFFLFFSGVLRSRGADQPGHYYVVVQGGQKNKNKNKNKSAAGSERVSVNILGQLPLQTAQL
jgi:hypothetical protein